MDEPATCTAFIGDARLAGGAPWEVALAVKHAGVERPDAMPLVFDDRTGAQIDFDLRGDDAEITARLRAVAEPARPVGRPRLGVVAREVTLLPRHWEWLAQQPGGASTALRRLVEAARAADGGATALRARTEAAYQFMAAMAGDLPGFEDGARALFAGDRPRFEQCISAWPADIRDETLRILASG